MKLGMKDNADSKRMTDMLTCLICGMPTTWRVIEAASEVIAFCSVHETCQQATAYTSEQAR